MSPIVPVRSDLVDIPRMELGVQAAVPSHWSWINTDFQGLRPKLERRDHGVFVSF